MTLDLNFPQVLFQIFKKWPPNLDGFGIEMEPTDGGGQLASPEKRQRKVPEKFRDQEDVQTDFGHTEPGISESDQLVTDTSVSPTTDSVNKNVVTSADLKMEDVPVKRKRGRPPKVKFDFVDYSQKFGRTPGPQVQPGKL